ncbi:hypothetical protein vseg_000631 [Gypsophila vaccaria]
MSSQNLQETIEEEATQDINESVPAQLPRYVTIKHSETGHYLAVVTEGNPKLAGFLEYNAAHDPQSPQAQFAVEKSFGPSASQWNVHLRSLYNNKYCIRQGSSAISFFRASARERGEQSLMLQCTLFKAFVKDSGEIQLLYLGSSRGVRETEYPNEGGLYWRLAAVSPNNRPITYFNVVDITTTKLVNLPRLVSFKGDDDKYLHTSRDILGRAFNIFNGASLEETNVLYEIFPTSIKNYVRIKSYHFDRFLRRGNENWIFSNSRDESEDDVDTLFELTQHNNHAVVLRNVGNNRFCTRLIDKTPTSDHLNAAAPDIPVPPGAYLQVVEPVLRRTVEVSPDNFLLENARIYDHDTFDMDHGIAANEDNVPRVMPLVFTFVRSRSSSWNNTETIQWGGDTTLTSGVPQIISESQVVIHGVCQEPCKWGQVVKEGVEIQVHRDVLVPPKTVIRATMVAKRATCEVPFSYVQTDQLTVGSDRTYNNADGLYKGTHVYAYDINEASEPMP